MLQPPQPNQGQNQKMDTASIVAFILGIAWIVAVFFLHMGGWVHVLLVLAALLSMSRIAKNPVR